MNSTELFELSWYIRDHLFRKYNQEGAEIVADNIPSEMITTYLRYRDADNAHLSTITRTVLEGLQKASILVPSDGSKLKVKSILSRFQCSKCKYVSYLSRVEPMKCLRCWSEQMGEFTGKRM